MKEQIRFGERVPPKVFWNKKTLAAMVRKNRLARLITNPIGSRRVHSTGGDIKYWVVKTKPSGRWVYEHRAIMERKIGRKLSRTEVVHHKNENPLDNRIGNLELLASISEHNKIHAKIRSSILR